MFKQIEVHTKYIFPIVCVTNDKYRLALFSVVNVLHFVLIFLGCNGYCRNHFGNTAVKSNIQAGMKTAKFMQK